MGLTGNGIKVLSTLSICTVVSLGHCGFVSCKEVQLIYILICTNSKRKRVSDFRPLVKFMVSNPL